MNTINLHKATPETARTAWARLSQKKRNSVVGTTFLKLIDTLDESGNAPLLASLDALFGGDDTMTAHKALKTQFVNRPFVDDNGNTLLKLCVSRISGKNPIGKAQVWFEVPEVLDANHPSLHTIPNEDISKRFTESVGIDVSGKESVQLAKSEALRAAEAAQTLKGSQKNDINFGITGARHGIRDDKFVDGAVGHDEALGESLTQPFRREKDSKPHSHSVVALPTLLQWAQDTSPAAPRLYALLGDAGSGKTSHGQQFARVLNGEVEHTNWPLANLEPNAPKALFVDLSELSGVDNLAQLSLEEMLVLVLKRLDGAAVQSVADVAPLVADARAGKVIFIFDGLDELLKNDPLVLQKVFEQFLKVVERHPNKTEGLRPPKAIVSCRSHYFRDVEAQHSFFTARGRNSVKQNDYRCMTLLPWGNDLIESYLTRRVGDAEATRLMQLIANTYNLTELASRPVLLSMMAENLQALLAEQVAGLPILASTLYSKTVASWIARDNGKHCLNPAHKPLLMGALAAALHNDEAEVWPADRLDQWLVRTVQALFPGHYAADDMQGIQNDLRTATFIVRPHDSQFNFAHKSYGEYFLARFMIDGLTQVADGFWTLPLLRQYLPQHTLNIETMAFLTEMWSTDNAIQLERTQSRRASVLCELLQGDDLTLSKDRILNQLQSAPPLHAVLWQMLLATKLPFSTTKNTATPFNLRGLDFFAQRWSDLSQTPPLDLRGANMQGMYLTHCKFGKVICDEHTNASDAVFRECDTSQIAWNKAQRNGLIIRGKSVPRAAGSAPLAGHWSRPMESHALSSLAFSPTENLLACGGADRTVRLWDVTSRAEQAVLKGHSDFVHSVAFSPDGKQLVSGGEDRTLRLWDVATKSELVVLKGHDDAVLSVAFSPCGNRLASTGRDGTVRLWDIATRDEIGVLKRHRGWVFCVVFSPCGKQLASGGRDGRVRLWDIIGRTELVGVLQEHHGSVLSLAFSPCGQQLASAGNDGTVRLWDATTKEELGVLSGHFDSVYSVTFNPFGKQLASADGAGTVRVWDVANKNKLKVLWGHNSPVSSIAFSPWGLQIASSGENDSLRLWDLTENAVKPAYQIIVPAPHAPFDPSWASFDGDGNLLDWSDSAVDHWLHVERNGRVAPIESVL